MDKYLVILLCVLHTLNDAKKIYKLNGPCKTLQNQEGTCKFMEDCLTLQQYVRPMSCLFKGSKEAVCCPTKVDSGKKEGEIPEKDDEVKINKYDNDKKSNVVKDDKVPVVGSRSSVNNMQCERPIYGNIPWPMRCCPKFEHTQPAEPEGCTPLPKIKTPDTLTDPAKKIAWRKCVENERFVHICEEDEKVPNTFRRVNVCNVTSNYPRISQGSPAQERQFPHMASLGCDNGIITADEPIVWIGGGSLISDEYILTAAHALESRADGPVRYALLGSLTHSGLKEGAMYFILERIAHQGYDRRTKIHDIGLVKLNKRVVFSSYIRPICLPLDEILIEARVVAGWGSLGYSVNDELEMATVTELPNAECNAQLKDYRSFTYSADTMLCAAGHKKGFKYTDSCRGDSGGPLMANIKNKEFSCNYVAVGIVSFGPKCGVGAPGSYTRVASYVDWIVRNVWPEEYKDEIDTIKT